MGGAPTFPPVPRRRPAPHAVGRTRPPGTASRHPKASQRPCRGLSGLRPQETNSLARPAQRAPQGRPRPAPRPPRVRQGWGRGAPVPRSRRARVPICFFARAQAPPLAQPAPTPCTTFGRPRPTTGNPAAFHGCNNGMYAKRLGQNQCVSRNLQKSPCNGASLPLCSLLSAAGHGRKHPTKSKRHRSARRPERPKRGGRRGSPSCARPNPHRPPRRSARSPRPPHARDKRGGRLASVSAPNNAATQHDRTSPPRAASQACPGGHL